jgi:thiamine pyrophosphate-dependent acetolactate synthase large subunit-like protein
MGLWGSASVYEMALPSFRRRRITSGSGGGTGYGLPAISVLGVDLGRNVRSVVGLDSSGAVVMRRKMRRETLIGLAERLPACVVAMEACCGAHPAAISAGIRPKVGRRLNYRAKDPLR